MPREQPPRKIVDASQDRTSGFQQVFDSSNQLASELKTHYDAKAGGKTTGNQQIKSLDTEKYVTAYETAAKPPPEAYQDQRELLGDLHRQTVQEGGNRPSIPLQEKCHWGILGGARNISGTP